MLLKWVLGATLLGSFFLGMNLRVSMIQQWWNPPKSQKLHGFDTSDYNALLQLKSSQSTVSIFAIQVQDTPFELILLQWKRTPQTPHPPLKIRGLLLTESQQTIPWKGSLSSDLKNRWLQASWMSSHSKCIDNALWTLELSWSNVKALTGEGQQTIQCSNTSFSEPVIAELIYDPIYAPLP